MKDVDNSLLYNKIEEHKIGVLNVNPKIMLKLNCSTIQAKLTELLKNSKQDFDYPNLESAILKMIEEELAPVLENYLNERLSDKNVMFLLILIASEKGWEFRGFRKVTIRILNGIQVEVSSPYCYAKTVKSKRGRKRQKRRKNTNPQGHLGLWLLGFVGHTSGRLASDVVKTALLCPSFEICETLLKQRGVPLGKGAIQRLCRIMGEVGIAHRGKISLSGDEDLAGHTLFVGTDGGRLRERTAKRGAKPKGQKQQGYHTDWKEPKLLTIYLLDKHGKVVKEFPPIYDATMQDADGVFDLIQIYLHQLPIQQLERIVFSGDGARWIWERFEKLSTQPWLSGIKIYQVLDYTHAKQALREIWELLPAGTYTNKAKVLEQWKNYVWEGQLDKLGESIELLLKGKNKAKGLKKWREYFRDNAKRMRYSFFEEIKIPCGSGYVESAIRRVINLRLKSAGSFWLKSTAENFLFLRSQLISGRWNIFMKNLAATPVFNMSKQNCIKLNDSKHYSFIRQAA